MKEKVSKVIKVRANEIKAKQLYKEMKEKLNQNKQMSKFSWLIICMVGDLTWILILILV